MLLQLYKSIYNFYQASADAALLRYYSPRLYTTVAPPNTEYPVIILNDSAGTNAQTFCTVVDRQPLIFDCYARTNLESVRIADEVKRIFNNRGLELEDTPTDNIELLALRFNSTSKSFDRLDQIWKTSVAFDAIVNSTK